MRAVAAILIGVTMTRSVGGGESLPPLVDGRAPRDLEELWGAYDPSREPVGVEIIKEWKRDGVVLRAIRYEVGTFKGARAWMGAIYGFPEGARNLPALIHCHGGGQFADANQIVCSAARGYAALSINWGEKPMTDRYKRVVEKPNTDWGVIHPSHAGHGSHLRSLRPDERTVDDVESPRNNNWFMWTLAARRGITFLQRQPEVDPDRIGMYGHSMGSRITLMTSGVDARLKAIAPSCGAPTSESENPWADRTVETCAYLPTVRCPVMFLNPTNDFFGTMDGVEAIIDAMGAKTYRLSRDPQMSHRTYPEHRVSAALWFDQHLKGTFEVPATPAVELGFDDPSRIPTVSVTVDTSRPVRDVKVYYSRTPEPVERFWAEARVERRGDTYVARCPVIDLAQPLYVFGNVAYDLAEPVTMAGPYHNSMTAENRFVISSRMLHATAERLRSAGIRATDTPSMMIDDLADGWGNWASYGLTRETRMLGDAKYRAPSADAVLTLEVRSESDTALTVRAVRGFRPTEFERETTVPVEPGGWRTVAIAFDKLGDVASKRGKKKQKRSLAVEASWRDATALLLIGRKGDEMPEIRNLRWTDGR
ncbi:MAG: dienelactone hydrolase family protein [Planctomycetota bacterium]|jgi:dienelactone hydrolase